jgi:hypothetical protein
MQLLIYPKIPIDEHLCHQRCDFEEIIHKKGDMLNVEKVKQAENKYQKSEYWQTLLARLSGNRGIAKECKIHECHLLVCYMTNHSKYTLHPLDCRRKVDVYNIHFQEG